VEERKVATLLFADLVGSTAMGDGQDPERTRVTLRRYWQAMRDTIEAHGGTVESFMGDGVMAVFGAPAALEHHATQALFAAQEMQRRMTELFEGSLLLRIGVNTGEVVVGLPVEGSSFVTGDSVNVAARLEQAAAPGMVLVGERTVAASTGFDFGEPTLVAAKGKPSGVLARPLVVAPAEATPPRSRPARAFVGRDAETRLLRTAYEEVLARGRPRLVVVRGDPGIGKTTLMELVWGWLTTHPSGPLLRSGRCLSQGRGVTYWPLVEVLRRQFNIPENDAPADVLERLGERPILALTLGIEATPGLHPFAAKEQLHAAWVDLVGELSSDRPVVLWVEDVHWADDLLLELVDRMVSDVQGPLLVVVTTRPEGGEHPALSARSGRGDRTSVWLGPLPDTEAVQLLETLAGTMPSRLQGQIVRRAEGNPFFLEEIVKALSEAAWQPAIPDSVQAVIAARIDALPDTAKSTLQAAAVIGRVFWSGPVSELVADGDLMLPVLEERGLVRSHPASSLAGQREYSFHHALSRQVTYESIPKARRTRLHADVAAWIEQTRGERDELIPLLAYHYAEATSPADADWAWQGEEARLAGLVEKAVLWLASAAALATAQYSLDEALALLDRALQLDQPDSSRVDLLSRLGRVRALMYDGEGFQEAFVSAIALSSEPAVRAELLAEMAFEVSARWGMFPRMPPVDMVDEWTAEALATAAPGSRARARALVAQSYWHPAGAAESAAEAWDIAEQQSDIELRSHAANARAFAAFADLDYVEARGWAERRLSMVEQVSDPDLLADTYGGVIPGCLGVGAFADARRFDRLHNEVASRLSNHHRIHAVAYTLELEELAEDWVAIRLLRARAEDASAANLETPCVRNARTLLVCALAELALGDNAAALDLEQLGASRAMPGAERTYSPLYLRLGLRRGALDQVERWIDLAVAPPPAKNWWALTNAAARLDALTALERWNVIEQEASHLARPGTYLEPFALRALGLAREDDRLLSAAYRSFLRLGLLEQADRTVGGS
jgi:class 3 adenylate cyclase